MGSWLAISLMAALHWKGRGTGLTLDPDVTSDALILDGSSLGKQQFDSEGRRRRSIENKVKYSSMVLVDRLMVPYTDTYASSISIYTCSLPLGNWPAVIPCGERFLMHHERGALISSTMYHTCGRRSLNACLNVS